MYKIPAVIFAGGKSSRMGEDKSQLPFADYTSLSEFQYRRLKQLFEEVYLSAKSGKFDFECPLLEDRYDIHSPLAALVSLFEALDTEEIFVLSVDAPFVDASVIEVLIEASQQSDDAIIAKSPNGVEPLCGIYRRTILPIAKDMLEKEEHRLTALLEKVKTRHVVFASADPFLNLNRPADYEEALKRLL